MTEKGQFVDFGAPEQFGTHVFRVEIPAARTEPVRIIEDYGHRGLEGSIPRDDDRVILPRAVWSGVADTARHGINNRLKAAKLPAGRSHDGSDRMERYVGKE